MLKSFKILVVAGTVAVVLALAACGCPEIRGPAADIADDLDLVFDHVAPVSTLTDAEKEKTTKLLLKLRENVKLLREAAK